MDPEFRICPHCGTEGILIMADGRCPNCKKLLIKDEEEITDLQNTLIGQDNIQSPSETMVTSVVKKSAYLNEKLLTDNHASEEQGTDWFVVKCPKCGEGHDPGIFRCTKCNTCLRPIFLGVITLMGPVFLILLAIMFFIQASDNPVAFVAFSINVVGIFTLFALRAGKYWAWIAIQVIWGINIVFSAIQAIVINPILLVNTAVQALIIFPLWIYMDSRRVKAFCSVGRSGIGEEEEVSEFVGDHNDIHESRDGAGTVNTPQDLARSYIVDLPTIQRVEPTGTTSQGRRIPLFVAILVSGIVLLSLILVYFFEGESRQMDRAQVILHKHDITIKELYSQISRKNALGSGTMNLTGESLERRHLESSSQMMRSAQQHFQDARSLIKEAEAQKIRMFKEMKDAGISKEIADKAWATYCLELSIFGFGSE